MKTTTLRVLCLAGLVAGSLTAGSSFAYDYRDDGRDFRHGEHGRYDHGSYGRHEVIVTRYAHHPRVLERRVIVERPVYYTSPAPVYSPPPSIGQLVGGLIGVVIDDNNNR